MLKAGSTCRCSKLSCTTSVMRLSTHTEQRPTSRFMTLTETSRLSLWESKSRTHQAIDYSPTGIFRCRRSRLAPAGVWSYRVPCEESILFRLTMSTTRYISDTTSRFKVFVANRLSITHEVTDTEDLHYISTKENPTDLASRGISPDDRTSLFRWLNWPAFLQEPNSTTHPDQSTKLLTDEQEDLEMNHALLITQVLPRWVSFHKVNADIQTEITKRQNRFFIPSVLSRQNTRSFIHIHQHAVFRQTFHFCSEVLHKAWWGTKIHAFCSTSKFYFLIG